MCTYSLVISLFILHKMFILWWYGGAVMWWRGGAVVGIYENPVGPILCQKLQKKSAQ